MLYKKSLGIASLITFLLALSLFSCPSAPSAKQGTAETQAQHDPSLPLWTGDGGKGLSLAVLEPTGRGISQNEQWMLSLIQSSLTGDFNKYSAMAIIDRQNLEKIIAEQMQSMSGFYSDDDYIRIGNLANAKFILGGSVTRTASTFMLELAVTEVESGVRKASLSPTPVTPAALENLSAVKEASAELLRQMGVTLTASGLAELKRPLAISQVNAETALARGVVAQRQGTEVAALSYYFQAASLDTSLVEAANRSSTMSANISSGNIGMDIRNDIAWRRDWVARLTETENFINNIPPPYTLFYSTGIETGAINYQTETADLSITTNLHALATRHSSVQKVLQAVYDGLNATGRKNDWNLTNWPVQGVTASNPLATQKQYPMQIVFELVNQRNQVIGRQTLALRPMFRFSIVNNSVNIEYTENTFNTVIFNAVKADDISDSLTIRIASVNGAAPQSAEFQITALTNEQWRQNRDSVIPHLLIANGVVKGFNSSLSSNQISQYRNLVIPAEYWGEPHGITAIGDRAFTEKQLTRVSIPDGVTSIGEHAFSKNQLTSIGIPSSINTIGSNAFSQAFSSSYNYSYEIPYGVKTIGRNAFAYNSFSTIVIPNSVINIGEGAFRSNYITSLSISNSVTSIGEEAFASNWLTSVIIPDNVKSIGDEAFFFNFNLTSITIGANVALGSGIVGRYSNPIYINYDFERAYNKSGKQAGTYTRPNANSRTWTRR